MKGGGTALVALVLTLAISGSQAAASGGGSWDPTFGCAGRVALDVPLSLFTPVDMALQPDGRIIVTGRGGGGQSPAWEVVTLRFLSDGSLDPSFGDEGVVSTAVTADGSAAEAVSVQADGKIVVAGSFGQSLDEGFALARYLPDGTPDPTFGSNGTVATSVAGGGGVRDIAVDPDGRMVAVGWAGWGYSGSVLVARYLDDGTLDGSFGASGIRRVSLDAGANAEAVALQADGAIVVAGSVWGTDDVGRNLVARFTDAGDLDTTFGTDGWVGTDAGDANYGGTAVAVRIQDDGKIVTVGSANLELGSSTFQIARYDDTGTLDASFGAGGIVRTMSSVHSWPAELAISQDGMILVAGTLKVPAHADPRMVVARFATDGSPDPGFGRQGLAMTGFMDFTSSESMIVQPDGDIIDMGDTYNSPNMVVLSRYAPSGELGPCADGQVARVGSRFHGDGLYRADGVDDQTAVARVAAGDAAIFRIRAQNDGRAPARLKVFGRYGSREFPNSYAMAGADLTSWVTSGYKTEPLPPGSWVTITLRVQVGADVPVGRVRDIRIHVRSFYSSQVRDVVVAEVVVV